MKSLFKTFFLSMVILFLSLSASYATNETDPLSSDVSYQIQQTGLDGLTYVLFAVGPERFFTPTFEFKAGNSLKVIGASHEYGELQGIWQEAPLGLLSYFRAQVEKSETATTTTIPVPDTTSLMSDRFETTEKTKFLIDLWGISYPSLPPPFSNLSMLIGAGAYLGANVIFTGFTGIPTVPTLGSISPSEGTQESTLTDVTITGVNTAFQDKSPVDITFSPNNNNELAISNISTISNTKIEFDLTIAVDAPVEFKSVTVTYDGGNVIINKSNAFEVLPK